MKQKTLIGISLLLLIIIVGCTKTIEKTIVINNTKECEACICQQEKICEACKETICDTTELTKERLLNGRLINEVENYKEVAEQYFNKTKNIEDCMYNLTIMQEKLNKIGDVIK